MKIMITGANGFIGKHLCRYLSNLGYEIFGVSKKDNLNTTQFKTYPMDLLDSMAVRNFILENRINGIIHLANLAYPGRDLEQFYRQIDFTVRPNISLALALPQTLLFSIFVGSCEEYGNGVTPFVEEQTPLVFSPYGWGKIASQNAVSIILREREINFCWVRPFLTFGPEQVSKSIIPSTIISCLNDHEVGLTPGYQTRDFIYILDLCKMFKILVDNHQIINNQIYNLCSGIPRTIRSVTQLINQKIGKGRLDFSRMPYRANEAMSFFGSNAKFLKTFGELPLSDFEEAIEITIESYKTQLKKMAS